MMEIQSSYIFLPNRYNKKEKLSSEKPVKIENYNIQINVPPTIVAYLKKAFPQISFEGSIPKLTCNEYSFSVEENGMVFHVKFFLYVVEGTTYLNICVSADGRSKTKLIHQLELIQDALLNSGLTENYIDIISYDAISEHYCNKILPKLNKLERSLRHLLFNIYILNFDIEYYKSAERKELLESIFQKLGSSFKGDKKAEVTKNYNVSSNDAKEINKIQHFFYSFDYCEIEKLLFLDNWTNSDQKAKEDFLSQNENLQALSDTELRNAFELFTPKSDWERFFSHKIDIPNIEGLFKQIHDYRNLAAHFKFFGRSEYEKSNLEINRLIVAIQKAIVITEEKDFFDRNRDVLMKSLVKIDIALSSFLLSLEDSIRESLNRASQSLSAITKSLTGLWQIGQRNTTDDEDRTDTMTALTNKNENSKESSKNDDPNSEEEKNN